MFENYEKFDMLKCFLETGENAEETSNLYLNRFPERQQPFRDIFTRLKSNLVRYGAFMKPKPKEYNRQARDVELEEIGILGEIQNDSKISTRKMERVSGIPRTSVMRILKKHKYKAYRVRKIHHLRQEDLHLRSAFCRWFLERCRENPHFARKIIWTDEACISSAGISNRYNCYSWTRENQHATIEQNFQGRYSFNVWVGIFGGTFIGPYIYDRTLTSDLYQEILSNYIENFIDNLPLANRQTLFFQHDGAPPHRSLRVTNYLTTLFGNNWLGNRGPIPWPARSPDLNPLDFFLWGRIKDLTFKQDYNSRQELEAALLRAFDSIAPVELLNSVKSVSKRCRLCLRQNGAQFEHTI